MSEPTKPKISGNDQTKQAKALGGIPDTKEVKEIMKANLPTGRRAPDGYRPS